MGHLEQQGRLADARITGQQTHRTGHHATAEYAVEFTDAGGKVPSAVRIDGAQWNGRSRGDRAAMSGAADVYGNNDLVNRAPGAAFGTATYPFRGHVAAF
jgi:hypothetical protein